MTGLDVDVTVERPGHTTSVAFRMRSGERLALLGPNGAGKTTVLEAIAGLAHPSSGEIRIGDLLVDGPGRHLRPDQRGVTILSQSTRLFPHLSALRNVEFGPRMQGRSTAGALEWLDRFGLADRAGAMPHELSGGQQQKVAIARAFAAEPRVLLLDEPFDALDATSTHDTRRMLTEALTDQATTSILVTHDLADAWQWASRCLIVERGRIVADTTTAELVSAPAREFTAALAGFGVLRGVWGDGVVDAGGVLLPAASTVRLTPGAAVVAIADPRAVEIA